LYSADVEISNNQAGESLIIPESAVLWTGKRSVVYIQPNPSEAIFEMREVELGNLRNDSYVVNSGLKSGDLVVAKGTFTVDAAAQLQRKKSMMNETGETNVPNKMKMEFSDEAQDTFGDLLEIYLNLKDALVASDEEQTQMLAQKGAEVASKISDLPMDDMGKNHISKLEEQLTKMSSKSNVEDQRTVFVELSKNMIQIGQHMNNLDTKLYVQHCPMANNDNGANWLSLEEEIRNPYYGDAMLTCGSVVGTID